MTRQRAPLVAAVLVVALLASGLTGASDMTAVRGGPSVSDAQPVPVRGDVASTTVTSGSAGERDADALRPRPVDDGTVRVGVIGSSFDRSHPPLDGRVLAYRHVGDRTLALDGGGAHDTAVAEVVAERSDAAGLYLAAVGQRPTPQEYDRAVGWLMANDVSVVVDAGSYFPSTAEGMARIATAAERAADGGAVFVTSAGNYARRHWRGAPSETGWVSFGNETAGTSTEGNRLGNGTTNGSVTLRLYWEGDADYDLYLYRDRPGTDDPVVGKSVRDAGNAEAIDATLPDGEYYVGVYVREPGSGPVDLFSATHRLAHTGTERSAVAPATAEGVIAVGAVGSVGEVRRYSSASDVNAAGGVSTDAAGRLRGTSAAAPLVAGTVIRMEESAATADLTSAEVERILRETAEGESRRVDPNAAVAFAGNVTTD